MKVKFVNNTRKCKTRRNSIIQGGEGGNATGHGIRRDGNASGTWQMVMKRAKVNLFITQLWISFYPSWQGRLCGGCGDCWGSTFRTHFSSQSRFFIRNRAETAKSKPLTSEGLINAQVRRSSCPCSDSLLSRASRRPERFLFSCQRRKRN